MRALWRKPPPVATGSGVTKMTAAKIVNVRIIKHRDTDLLLGISDEMRGLYVHGRSVEELENRIAAAIRELLEAEGKVGVQVLPVQDSDSAVVTEAFVSTNSIRKFAIAA